MSGHMGQVLVTTQNVEVAKVDVERGLIMIKGGVPGSKGSWVMVRDAVKRPLAEGCAEACRGEEIRRSGCPPLNSNRRDERSKMKVKVLTLDAGAAGEVELSEDVFGVEPRADILARVVQWQENRRHKGQHRTLTRAEIDRTTKKIYKQKGTGQARHGAAVGRVSSAAAPRRWARSCARARPIFRRRFARSASRWRSRRSAKTAI